MAAADTIKWVPTGVARGIISFLIKRRSSSQVVGGLRAAPLHFNLFVLRNSLRKKTNGLDNPDPR